MARIKDEYLITPDRIECAKNLYETYSVGDLGRIMGVSTMTVYNLLKAGNVKMRNQVEAAHVRAMNKAKCYIPPKNKRVYLASESAMMEKARRLGISYRYRTEAERDWLVANQVRINQMEGRFNPRRHTIYQGATYQSSLQNVA